MVTKEQIDASVAWSRHWVKNGTGYVGDTSRERMHDVIVALADDRDDLRRACESYSETVADGMNAIAELQSERDRLAAQVSELVELMDTEPQRDAFWEHRRRAVLAKHKAT